MQALWSGKKKTTRHRMCWYPVASGKYYFTKNKSTLMAFAIGSKYNNNSRSSSEGGFKIIGTHTDSPNLRVKSRLYNIHSNSRLDDTTGS